VYAGLEPVTRRSQVRILSALAVAPFGGLTCACRPGAGRTGCANGVVLEADSVPSASSGVPAVKCRPQWATHSRMMWASDVHLVRAIAAEPIVSCTVVQSCVGNELNLVCRGATPAQGAAYRADGADNRFGNPACLCGRGSSAAALDRHRRRPSWGTDRESTMPPTVVLAPGSTVSNRPSRLHGVKAMYQRRNTPDDVWRRT
jgi:hypothetical protein